MKIYLIVAAIVLAVFTTFGYAWHGDCWMNGYPPRDGSPPPRDRFGSGVCSTLSGVFFPLYWGFKGSIFIMNPARSWPRVRFETTP